ncbi:hypothetical protein [Ktedonospora formicarum]|uniref:Uncharacterized protein n=1 Tax=Ktedonospora formicarum TaxID=2778364 RepID=A0A8J3MWH6_9CHLR|nr:hypothetical protein [Ktedonospora formicarum]GHO51447.1 hypothetical protein KSX_96100 [Ktedonospora formicarum]
MQRPTYTITQCCQLFHVNAKTFHKWLAREHIEAQQSRADTRIRYLTQEQVDHLVRVYDLSLPSSGEAFPSPSATENETGTIPTSDVALLREQLREQGRRLDELEREVRLLQVRVQDLERPREQMVSPSHERSQPLPEYPTSSDQGNAPAHRMTAEGKKRSKKKSRGKRLPAGLILLREFAERHHISMNRASTAANAGKIVVIRGKWLVNSRWASEAIDGRGQCDFYQLFHQREGFEACQECPHQHLDEEKEGSHVNERI